MPVSTRTIAKHSSVYAAGSIAQKLTSFILIPIYTQYLTTSDYGTLELLTLVMYFVSILLGSGISQAVVRLYYDTETQEDKDRIIVSALIYTGFIGVCGLVVLLPFSGILTRTVLDNTCAAHCLVIALIGTAFGLTTGICMTVLRVWNKPLLFVGVSMCQLVAMASLNILLLVYFKLGVVSILISSSSVFAVTSLFLTIYILKHCALSASWSAIKKLLRFGGPLIFSALGMLFLHSADRFLLQRLASSSELGLYALAYKFATIPMVLVAAPFMSYWEPGRFALGQSEEARRKVAQVFTYFCFVFFWASLGLAATGADLVRIAAADDFHAAGQFIPLLVLSYVFFGLQCNLNYGILHAQRTGLLGYLTVVIAAFNIGLNLWLIPHIGAWGATAATLCSFMSLAVLTFFISQYLYRIQYHWGRLAKLSLATLIVFGVSQTACMDNALYAIVAKLACILCLPAILMLLRFFTHYEIESMRRLLLSVPTRLPQRPDVR